MTKLCLGFIGICALFLSFSACMRMGPDYRRPDPWIQLPPVYQHTPEEADASKDQDRWWLVFDDQELNRLVDDVLENNLEIKSAAASVLELRARFVQTRAERFPEVGTQGQWQRQKLGSTFSIPGAPTSVTTTHYNLSLPASWELDLWGLFARAEEAALADLLAAEETRRAVAQTAVAEAVALYLQMESLERRIQVSVESIKSFQHSMDLVEGRYERGLSDVLAVRQARRILKQAESILPSLRQELGITQQRLHVLAGRYPRATPPREQPEDYYRRLKPVPPGLPSELLLRRPDIRAAEAGLQALNALVGVAKAGRFPHISLTGSFGYASPELGDLLKPESEIWSLALGIIQPVFDAGKLNAGQQAAEARYQKGVAEYAKLLLTAFFEVEQALLTREQQLERRERVMAFLEEARATQLVAENRYERGLIDYISVLDAQQTRFEAEGNLVLVDLAILTNRVSLHRALGGGWAEPEPVEAAENRRGLPF